MTGYPDTDTYFQIIDELVTAWAKIIEAGIPFSDPAADGPLLTEINHTMVAQGMDRDSALALIQEIKKRYPQLWICIMTYANLVYRYGYGAFYTMMQEYKIDWLLLPDIPLQEVQAYGDTGTVDKVMLVSDTLSDKDIIAIAKESTWYLYVLSFVGTTWHTHTLQSKQEHLRAFITRLRTLVWDEKKLVVWFGISTAEDIAFLRTLPVDGYIIWSAIARAVKKHGLEGLREYLRENII